MTNTEDLERRFEQHLLDLNRQIGVRSTAMGKPYWPRRFREMVKRRGGLGAARRYLASRTPQPGFHRTINLGLPELSLEVIVLQHPWRTLFSPQELAEARGRLAAERAHLRNLGDERLADLLERVLRQLEA